MKLIYGILIAAFAYASEKPEVSLTSQIRISQFVSLNLEDLILKPQPVPAELLDIPITLPDQGVTKAELLEWFKSKKETYRELNLFTFNFPEKIELEVNDSVTASFITNRIVNRLKVKCSDCEYQIKFSHLPKPTTMVEKIDFAQLPASGPFMLSTLNAKGEKSGWVTGQIQTSRNVVKANRFLRSGDRLRLDDLVLEKTDISFIKDYYTDVSQLVGKKTSRALSVKATLSSSDIERSHDIKQGQSVKARAGTSGFEVVIQAVALDSGSTGDIIRIRNINYQKMLTARVIEPGLVEIQ